MKDLTWLDDAACRGMPLDHFFPEGNSAGTMERMQAAKAVCAICPVQSQCAQWAKETECSAGIFGGRDEFERNGRQRRPKRIPRKRAYSEDTLEKVRQLTRQRYSETEIALMLRVTPRTVARYKQRMRAMERAA